MRRIRQKSPRSKEVAAQFNGASFEGNNGDLQDLTHTMAFRFASSDSPTGVAASSPNAASRQHFNGARHSPLKSDDRRDESAIGGLHWYVDPITVKVMHDRTTPYESSGKTLDLAAQRGECERAQVWLWDDRELTDVIVQFADLALVTAGSSVLGKQHWSYKQVGFVNASSPSRYSCLEDILTGETNRSGAAPHPCLSGWYP